MPPSSTTRKGRPPAAEPAIRINLTLDQPTLDRIAAYQDRHDLDAMSAAVRHIFKADEHETARKGRKDAR